MAKKGEKILTQKRVDKLGLFRVSVITADMLSGFTSIGECAFDGCCNLISIEIPNSVTSIRDGAFYNCTTLTSIEIPDSVASIGDYAFDGCSSLTSITIPNSVTSIGFWAFCGCTSLISMIIPSSVTSIGYMAFAYCRGLTSIEIPNSVTSIGEGVFFGCVDLTSLTIGYKTYEKQTITNGKCKAYKAFNANMSCHGFQYEEDKTYEFDGEPELCKHGFHACLNFFDIFNYYWGKINKDIVIHEVELEGISEERTDDSKVVAKKITIGKRIL